MSEKKFENKLNVGTTSDIVSAVEYLIAYAIVSLG